MMGGIPGLRHRCTRTGSVGSGGIFPSVCVCVCVGPVACRIPQVQRGGKGSGPTSPEVQEEGGVDNTVIDG